MFVTLETGFFAVVQVIVYIGAIANLIIFALMLTRRDMLDSTHQTNQYAWLSVLVSLGVAGGLIGALTNGSRL